MCSTKAAIQMIPAWRHYLSQLMTLKYTGVPNGSSAKYTRLERLNSCCLQMAALSIPGSFAGTANERQFISC